MMPRDGAIIFRYLVGKLEVLARVGLSSDAEWGPW